MTSEPTGWLPVAITGVTSLLAGGSAGALITTYGGKGRERRNARSAAMAALLACEEKRRAQAIGERSADANRESIAEFQARCVVARVPSRLVELYKAADREWRSVASPPGFPPKDDGERLVWVEFEVANKAVERAADLLSRSLWHPLANKPLRRWRGRQLNRMMGQVFGRNRIELNMTGWYRVWRTASGKMTRWDHFRERLGRSYDWGPTSSQTSSDAEKN